MFDSGGIQVPQPYTPQRAPVYIKGRDVILTGYSWSLPPQRILGSTSREFLQLTSTENWWFENLQWENDGADIVAGIRHYLMRAVSDGLYQDSFATAAVIIEGEASSIRPVNTVIAPGGGKDMSAYRAELTGIYTLQWVVSLCAFYEVYEGGISFRCDGESALIKAFSSSLPFIDEPCFDLLAAIHKIRKECPIKWNVTHIQGHQDD